MNMLQQVGRFLLQAREKKGARFVATVLVFLIFGVADFLIAWVINASAVPAAAHGAIDGITVGGFAAFLTWFLLEAAQRERERLRAELEQEAKLNHEIRNALETIGQAGYLISDVSLKNLVSDSVKRIDSILKERTPPPGQ